MHCCADQRNMGMSMKVERSTVDQIKQRFEFNKKKKEEEKKKYGMYRMFFYDFFCFLILWGADFEERMKELREDVSDCLV